MNKTVKRMTAVLMSMIMMTTIFTALPFTVSAQKLEAAEAGTNNETAGAEFFSHEAFDILSSVPDGNYYQDEEIDILVAIKKYYFSYDEHGSQVDSPNRLRLEIGKDGGVSETTTLFIYAGMIGMTRSVKFTPTSVGEYTVRVSFEKDINKEFDNESYVGSFTFNVKSDAISNDYFTILNPTASGDYTVNEEIILIIDIKKFVPKYAFGQLLENLIVLDFSKDDQVVYTMKINYKKAIGTKRIGGFIPTESGEYTLHADFYAGMDKVKDMGSYSFKVKSSTEPTTVEPTTVEPTTVEPTTEPKPDVKVGDVNNDGTVNGADAGVLSRFAAGWKGYEDKIKNMAAADINGDGNVNGADAGILARYTSGWKQYDKYFES